VWRVEDRVYRAHKAAKRVAVKVEIEIVPWVFIFLYFIFYFFSLGN